MFLKTLIVILIIGVGIWAVRSKVFLKRRRSFGQIENAVESPASIAIGEMVAVAGGIYVSMILLASFLKLSLPEKISVLAYQVDPLAFIAIIVATLQPILLAYYYRIVKRF